MYNPFVFDTEEYKEKTEIRRAANGIGAAYSSMLAFSFVLQITIMLVAVFIMGSKNATAMFENTVFLLVLQTVMSVLMFTLPYMLATRLANRKISSVAAFKKPITENTAFYVMLGVGFCAMGEFLANIFATRLSFFGIEPAMPEIELGRGVFGVVLTFIATAVVPALVEEFAVRGVVMGVLRRFGDIFAILISAIVFGLMHGNLVQIPFAFVVGLGLGFAAVKTGSVWTSVIIHFINNFISVVLSYLLENVQVGTANIIYICVNLIMLAVGVAGFVALSEKEKNLFSFERGSYKSSGSQKAKWFFGAPFIIISLVITGIEIIAAQVLY